MNMREIFRRVRGDSGVAEFDAAKRMELELSEQIKAIVAAAFEERGTMEPGLAQTMICQVLSYCYSEAVADMLAEARKINPDAGEAGIVAVACKSMVNNLNRAFEARRVEEVASEGGIGEMIKQAAKKGGK